MGEAVSGMTGKPDGTAHRILCRTRVVAEMYQRRRTQIAEHLKLVLTIIDRQVH